jgi:hypothetical protein
VIVIPRLLYKIVVHNKVTATGCFCAAGGSSKSTAVAAAATSEDDGSRESGELSPSQPSDSQDVSSGSDGGSDGGAAVDAAASSGDTAAAAGSPAAGTDAGSGARQSPSPDRGSDCLSLSIGSDFGWVWSEPHSAADCCGALLAP